MPKQPVHGQQREGMTAGAVHVHLSMRQEGMQSVAVNMCIEIMMSLDLWALSSNVE